MKFDARVSGTVTHLANAKKHLDKPLAQVEADKLKAAESKLLEKLPPAMKRGIKDLFKSKAPTVGHIRCDRFTFLEPLREYACFLDGTTPEEVIEENAWTQCLHLVLMGNNDTLIVPFEFNIPYSLQVEGRSWPVSLCSAVNMKAELDHLDQFVAVEHTLGVTKFPNFIEFSDEQMNEYERSQGVGRRFWAKFGVAVMRTLIDLSLNQRLPVWINPQFGSVPLE